MTNLLVFLGITGIFLMGVQIGYMLGRAREQERQIIFSRARYRMMNNATAEQIKYLHDVQLPNLSKWRGRS